MPEANQPAQPEAGRQGQTAAEAGQAAGQPAGAQTAEAAAQGIAGAEAGKPDAARMALEAVVKLQPEKVKGGGLRLVSAIDGKEVDKMLGSKDTAEKALGTEIQIALLKHDLNGPNLQARLERKHERKLTKTEVEGYQRKKQSEIQELQAQREAMVDKDGQPIKKEFEDVIKKVADPNSTDDQEQIAKDPLKFLEDKVNKVMIGHEDKRKEFISKLTSNVKGLAPEETQELNEDLNKLLEGTLMEDRKGRMNELKGKVTSYGFKFVLGLLMAAYLAHQSEKQRRQG